MGTGHAVVVGGGLAGTLAAGALLGHVETVTLVERDRYPERPAFRKGVPQGRHLHVLLSGGRRALEELFPGLGGELEAAGAHRLEPPRDVLTKSANGWQRRFHEGRHTTTSCTRALFDATVRARVLAEAEKSGTRVEVLQATEAIGLLGGADRVTGVRVRARDAGRAERELPADLVVDASGRGSRAPRWLAELGAPAPREEVVDAGIGYCTQMFRPAEPLDVVMVIQPRPDCPRGAAWSPVEGGNWLLTLSGVRGQHPPTESTEVLGFVESLGEPALYEHLRSCEPVSPRTGSGTPPTAAATTTPRAACPRGSSPSRTPPARSTRSTVRAWRWPPSAGWPCAAAWTTEVCGPVSRPPRSAPWPGRATPPG
ncbi:NAD(P)/FAD-dependent oxidoreductase [Streptomyces hygroscopicus]|uniref:NAD(P)/FAD-dependent oxidoreductase n=1 Tax=Streptomyces hygroscopicus TaxID=1912 RepID=UPI0036851AFC